MLVLVLVGCGGGGAFMSEASCSGESSRVGGLTCRWGRGENDGNESKFV